MHTETNYKCKSKPNYCTDYQALLPRSGTYTETSEEHKTTTEKDSKKRGDWNEEKEVQGIREIICSEKYSKTNENWR